MMIRTLLPCILLAIALLAQGACRNEPVDEGDGDGDVDGDADGDSDGDTDGDTDGDADGDSDGDTDGDTDGDVESDCDLDGFTASRDFTYEIGGELLAHIAHTNHVPPFDMLSIRTYPDYENTPTGPGTYSLDGYNYQDCGLCLLAFSNCDKTDCEKTFYADLGSVEITSFGGIGDTLTATIRDAVFQEVEIDDNWLSTPVPNGETWCLDDYVIDREILDPDEAYCADDYYYCPGETVPDFSLMSCGTGEMVSMSSLAEGKQALLFVMTAGWCPACRDYLPTVVSAEAAREGLQVVYVLGEADFEGDEPTLSYCQGYASSYVDDPGRFYIDFDGKIAFDAMFTYLYIYLDDDGTYSLPYTSLLDAETFEYLYSGFPPEDLFDQIDALLQ